MKPTIQVALVLSLCTSASAFASPGGDWVEQRAQLPAFLFSIRFLPDAPPGGSGTPVALRIRARSSGKILQELVVAEGAPMQLDATKRLGLVDANFDGESDIEVLSSGGRNALSDYAVFDRSRQRFVHDAALSRLPVSGFNADHTISTFYSGGCCEHLDERWRYVAGRLVRVGSVEQHVDQRTGEVVTRVGRRAGGRMHYSEQRVRVGDGGAPPPVPGGSDKPLATPR